MLYNQNWETKVNPTAVLLREAADLIEKRGHAKHYLIDREGRMCLVGALYNVPPISIENAVAAAQAVGDYLKSPTNALQSAIDVVVDWNNAPERTGQEVIDAMRKTADALERA